MKIIDTFIEIAAPPSRVWEVLMNFETYSEWNPFITSISGSGRVGDKLTVRIQPPGKSGMTFKPTVLVSNTEHEFRWKGKLFISGLFDGEHHFRLEPAGEGTLLHHGERFTGLLVPLLSGTFPATEQGFNEMNQELKTRAES
jgi:hypothetical protein